MTIRIKANFTSLPETILGTASARFYRRFLLGDRWYPDALADARAGSDQGEGQADILAEFNSGISSWYFGTDGYTPSGKYDFVSLVLHEIAHGLGFSSGIEVEENTSGVLVGKIRLGSPAYPVVYNFFVVNGSGTSILTFTDPSAALFQQLTSDNLFWNGGNGVAGNGGSQPKLYAPTTWDFGSSYTHLDEYTFSAGDLNSLMTPYVNQVEGIHNPGPITLGMLQDMGWTINAAPTFSEGDTTTRSVAENTSADQNIGSVVSSTDADHTTLT